ncbi:MAG TPA: galactokinase [Flavisolibacter sp.]|nr:galactokinase [Flavisolibacter sp.]
MQQEPFNAERFTAQFRELYKQEPLLVRSPGRVNIIGEHTDYNDGFVLPAAIDKAAHIAIAKRNDDTIRLYAQEFNESFECTLSTMHPTDQQWPNYILGVVDQLQKRGYTTGGFDLLLEGNVPIGAGLSSSASIECATAFALNELFQLGIEKKALPEIAQKAEHVYAKVLCGIMDQFASVFGKKDHVIKLDCRSLDYEYVPLKMDGIKILLLNTNVKHSLASTAYNQRRKECEEGAALVRRHHPEVKNLRDVTLEQLDQYVPKDSIVYQRCRFVIEENIRLLTACEDLRHGDIPALGQKMFRAHDGLSKEYEVSCKELDFLVDAVRDNPDVLGARMMGGGFGGCTINLVKEAAVDGLIEKLSQVYESTMQLPLTAYVAQIADGTGIMEASVVKS